MSSYHLQIVTPDGEIFDGQVEKLFCRTIAGDICVLANHADLCTAVGMGEAHIEVEGKTRYAACMGGMLSVIGDRTRLVATTWEWEEDIDLARAQAAKKQAEKMLEDNRLNEKEIDLAQAKLRRALVRSSVMQDDKF